MREFPSAPARNRELLSFCAAILILPRDSVLEVINAPTYLWNMVFIEARQAKQYSTRSDAVLDLCAARALLLLRSSVVSQPI